MSPTFGNRPPHGLPTFSFVVINKSGAAAADILVAAPGAGKKIVAYGFSINGDGDEDITFQSNDTDVHGPMFSDGSGWGEVAGYGAVPMFECAPNEALKMDRATGSVAIGGSLTYAVQDA
jgi:hypothetical protein